MFKIVFFGNDWFRAVENIFLFVRQGNNFGEQFNFVCGGHAITQSKKQSTAHERRLTNFHS